MLLASFVRFTDESDGGRTWLTSRGTLTRRSTNAILDACAALELHPRDCADEANARIGPFAGLRPEVAAEANLLLRKCELGVPQDQCPAIIEDARYIRDSAIGRIGVEPLEMEQGRKTTFTISVTRTRVDGEPGVEEVTDPDFARRDAGARTAAGPEYIRYTRKTCFQLDGGDNFAIEDNDKPKCPPMQQGGAVAFKEAWKVTPLTAGNHQELAVYRILYRGEEEIERQRQEPFPVKINVTPEKNWMEKLRKWFEEATDLTVSATGFVTAISGLIAAIAGLSIWSWLRRRKKKAEGDPKASP